MFSIINLKKAVLVFTFTLIVFPLFCQEQKFTWNVGTFELVGTFGSHRDSGDNSIMDSNLTFVDLQYHSLGSPWTFQISLFEYDSFDDNYNDRAGDDLYGILSPVEVNYNLLGTSFFLLGPYVKGGGVRVQYLPLL
jgi:hypothetical protein